MSWWQDDGTRSKFDRLRSTEPVLRRRLALAVAWCAAIPWTYQAVAVEPPSSSSTATDSPQHASRHISAYGDGNGAIWLLQMERVQREIGLSAARRRELKLLVADLAAATRRVYAGTLGITGPNREKLLADKRQQSYRVTKQYNVLALKLLTPQQAERLDGLYIRRLDLQIFFQPDAARLLNITPAQQARIRTAVEKDKAGWEEAVLLLRPAQQADLKRRRGAPFRFPQPQLILKQPDDPSGQ